MTEPEEVLRLDLEDPAGPDDVPRQEREPVTSRIRQLWERLIGKIRGIFAAVRGINEKREKLQEFLENPQNREMISYIWKRAKKLLGRVFPRKIRGRVTFGLEDPYLMGQILTGLSVLYPLFGPSVSVEPIFDRTVLEAEGELKGKLRMVHFASFAVQMLLNKHIRTLVKGFLDK